MFTIYSIGDSAFLAQILNALAMICGTGDFKTLVGVGALLGLLVMGFQCLTSGTRQFNLHQVLIGMICYMCFFGPGVTVQVEDAYTDEVRVVDNVPLGTAAAGTIISNIGYGVTALFEQGYGTADRMTEHAFLEPLKVLTGVRSAARDVSIIEAAGKAIGNADLAQDIDNYLRECTMVKITLGQATPDAIYRGGTNELFYDSSVYGTHLSTAGDVTCAEATPFIRQSLDALGEPDAAAALNRLLNIKEAGQTAQHLDKVDSALQMLDTAGNNGTDYLKLAVLQPLYDKAASGFYKDMGDAASAVMVNQAVEQRNQQWAAEGTMFVSTMRPLMAFFEGFIYAITPLMGFLLVVGAFGLNMLGKYFQVVIWIQLWMPVLSIINLYISMAARNEFSALVTAPISFYTLNSGSQALQTWLGVGGMLTAATPMIALFLVTGSTYAFTALAGRMGGADHVNERIGSPDMLKPGGYLQQADHFKSDQITGTSAVGFTPVKYTLGSGISNGLSELSADVLNQSDAAIKMAASNNASGKVDQQTRAINESVGQSLESNHQKLFNTISNELISQGAISGKNAAETRQAVGAVATQLVANAGANGSFGIGRNINQATDKNSRQTSEDWYPNGPWAQKQKPVDADFSKDFGGGQPNANGFAPSGTGGGSQPSGSSAASNSNAKPLGDGTVLEGEAVWKDDKPNLMDNVLRNSKGIEGNVSAGVTGNVSGSGTRSVSDQSGNNRLRNVAQSVATNISEGDAAALVDAARYGVQYSAAHQSSESQTHTDSSGLSSTISSIRQKMDSYSQLKSLQRNSSGSETRDLSEWVNAINANEEARGMLRSVSNQITGEAAVQRNKMAEEFKRQGYRADVAYDMANFQIIGHHQHLGGEAMKAQIAATSTGISRMDGLAAPVKQDYLEKGPETISHDGLKSQIVGADYDDRRHELGMNEPSEKVGGGHEMVLTAHSNFINASGNEAVSNRAEMRGRVMNDAIQKLFAPTNISAAQEFMGGFSNLFANGSYADQMRDLKEHGFSIAQGNALQYLRHHETLRDSNGNLNAQGQALYNEVRDQLGGDKADPKTVDAVFDRMVEHLDAAADANAPAKAVSVLAYNDAINGLGKIGAGEVKATTQNGAFFDYGSLDNREAPSMDAPKKPAASPKSEEKIQKIVREDEKIQKSDFMKYAFEKSGTLTDN